MSKANAKSGRDRRQIVEELSIQVQLTSEQADRIISQALREAGIDPDAPPRTFVSPPARPELAAAAKAKRTQPPPEPATE